MAEIMPLTQGKGNYFQYLLFKENIYAFYFFLIKHCQFKNVHRELTFSCLGDYIGDAS